MLPIRVDYLNKFTQWRVARARNLLQPLPEVIFKADACLVAINGDRALDDWRFHGTISLPEPGNMWAFFDLIVADHGILVSKPNFDGT